MQQPMSEQQIQKIARWLARAEECLTLAEAMHDPSTAATMRATAASYMEMIRHAEAFDDHHIRVE